MTKAKPSVNKLKTPILDFLQKRKKKRILKNRRKAVKEMTEIVEKLVGEIEEQERIKRANKILNKNLNHD
jgi:uncharacterized protein YllA (UPF0747 family)